jgi:ComF family protein
VTLELSALRRRALEAVAPPLCFGCGHGAGRAEPLCAPCRAGLRRVGDELATVSGVELWAPLAYEGAARSLVAALKFRAATSLADVMAGQIAAGAPASILGPGGARPVLVPVPLHPARLRRRGYNQAQLICAALAGRTGLGTSDCLERRGAAATQVGRGRSERGRAISGAVRARPGTLLPAHAVLVDDVVTTGATLAACAEALLSVGARSVRAVVYARTPGR